MMNKRPEERMAAYFEELSRTEDLAGTRVLAAVSGGSDSVAMLCILRAVAPSFGLSVSAVTVNHMIRSREESSGDASFVRELCARFDPPVPCAIEELSEGEVENLAASRGRGIEDAARHLRYERFVRAANDSGSRFICTGHTRDDQLETVLMRFLQGAGGSSLGGIARRRDQYLRPVIDCARRELASWLRERGISWREDSTNAEDRYYRNRVRHHLVPLLEREFPGWDTGVLAAAERSRSDDRFCRGLLEVFWVRADDGLRCSVSDYASLHPALRLRLLQDGLVLLAPSHRVSSGFLGRLSRAPEEWPDGDGSFTIAGSGLALKKEGCTLFFGPDIVQKHKSGYLVTISASGAYRLPSGIVAVSERDGGVFLDGRFGPFGFPLVIRSRSGGDSVLAADGRQKTLKKLMNDWSVAVADRDRIPIVERDGEIRAVYGSVLGYPDWFVHT